MTSSAVRWLQKGSAAAAVLAVGCALFGACGTAIDLGGTLDGAAPPVDVVVIDAQAPDAGNVDCEPCTASTECRAGSACIHIAADAGGNTFCAALCPSGNECDSDETCASRRTSEGPTTRACAPKTGACPTASGPSSTDGAPLDHCGVLVGPDVSFDCESCTYDCQRNGCYAGWWCNTKTRRCERPPSVCP